MHLVCQRIGIHVVWVLFIGAMMAPQLTWAQQRAFDPFAKGKGKPDAKAQQPNEGQMASGEFVDTPITDVFRVVSDLTGWSIIMSPDVSKSPPKVNLWVKDMRPEEVLTQVVNLSGLVLHRESANNYHVMTFEEYTKLFGVERQVRQLKNAKAEDVVKVLTPFVEGDKAAKILPVASSNKVVLLVPQPLMDQLNRLIDTIDVPFLKENKVHQLKHITAKEAADVLKPFLSEDKSKSEQIIPVDASNKVILLVAQPLLDELDKLLDTVDVPFKREHRVYSLKHVTARDVVDVLKPFVEGQKTDQVIAAEASNKVVLLVAQPLMDQLVKLIEDIDVPFQTDHIEIVRLKYLEADVVTPLLEKFLTKSIGKSQDSNVSLFGKSDTSENKGKPATKGQDSGDDASSRKAGESFLVQFMVEPKLNAVVLRGLPSDVKRAVDLLHELDESPNLEVVSYQLNYTDAKELRDTLEKLVSESGRSGGKNSGRLRVAISEQNNRIVVEGSLEDQKRMAVIIKAIDQPLPTGAGDIRVYHLENSNAEEVAKVLQEMLEEDDEKRASVESGQNGSTGSGGTATAGTSGGTSGASGGGGGAYTDVKALPARVTAAPEINAVVVRASSAEHDSVAQVVTNLDHPREQVMIEVTLVTVRATDEFNLGVDLGGKIGIDGTDILGFSTFGITEVDSLTGALSIADPASFGGTMGVFNSDDFSLVVNALQTVGDVRISSVPKVLVEDNSEAEISQVNEEPYEVTSQGDSTSVTSFGGYVEAGTTLTVLPHISKDNWLRLEYQVNLSSFGTRTAQQLAANLPPPKTSNDSKGTVRVPSGHMVVLGGLTSSRDSKVLDKVPLLGDVPVLGELFKNRDNDTTKDTLFVFIRPTVLRDQNFSDLKWLSQHEMDHAQMSDQNYPSNPLKLFESTLDMTKRDTASEKKHD